MTHHVAYSLELEQVLQIVDPSVALPYWDFTIDKHLYDVGNWSTLGNSPMWGSEWFGRAGGEYDTVTEGRWAYIQVKSNVWGQSKHNSYGFMRAPWNNNNRPYLTRSHHMCGFKFEAMPKCSDHYEVRVRARLVAAAACAPSAGSGGMGGGASGAVPIALAGQNNSLSSTSASSPSSKAT